MTELIEQIEYGQHYSHLPCSLKLVLSEPINVNIGDLFLHDTSEVHIFWGYGDQLPTDDLHISAEKKYTIATTVETATFRVYEGVCPIDAFINVVEIVYKSHDPTPVCVPLTAEERMNADESRATDSLLSRVRELLFSYT